MTVEQALKHPTWAMGGKITIDSATLMNKGLEVIEAHWLFGTPYDQIGVVVHPQSIVHALVSLCDGATLAHLGHPTCACRSPTRCTIPSASTCRCRRSTSPRSARSTFEPPDLDAFPCLRLAREAADGRRDRDVRAQRRQRGRRARVPHDRLSFMGIPAVIERRSRSCPPSACTRSTRSTGPTPRRGASAQSTVGRARMSWVLAFLGFALLIILHELGHFTAAKAVGMRVERFACSSRRCWAACAAARPSTRSGRSRSAAT